MHAKCGDNNKCVCRANNIAVNERCLPIVNGFCWKNETCGTKNSICIDSTCQCKPGFKFSPQINDCLQCKLQCHKKAYDYQIYFIQYKFKSNANLSLREKIKTIQISLKANLNQKIIYEHMWWHKIIPGHNRKFFSWIIRSPWL